MDLRLIIMLLIISFTACGDNPEKDPNADPYPSRPAPTVVADTTQDDTRYSWVEDLNMRDEPATSGKVITRLAGKTPLRLTGEATPNEQAVVLRGGLYVEPWYEVTTPDSLTGWVFGGALKKKDERKGNPPLTKLAFNYPHFGQYDLTRWELERTENTGGDGDVTGSTETYRGDGQRIRIETFASEYGYGINHTLLNLKHDILKSRKIFFDNESGEFLEEVVDHLGAEPKLYRRSQLSPLSYQQLNARPTFVQGEFTELAIEEAALN